MTFRIDSGVTARDRLIEGRHVEAIIRLPEGIFFETGIGGAIVLLSKEPCDTIQQIDLSDAGIPIPGWHERAGRKRVKLSDDTISTVISVIKKARSVKRTEA